MILLTVTNDSTILEYIIKIDIMTVIPDVFYKSNDV